MTVNAAPVEEGVVLQTTVSNGTALLFDLNADPNEQYDLSRQKTYAPVLEALLGMWEAAAESAVWPKYPPTDPNS
eukprot:CAMPEP_0119500968 /NCGR_PEP_ID=MMETSP1344-20130328/22945_1 /TAXON_ID=236787 /ORGANISM="Florenciella parvula, Strain CCMP2471" /LENGTH=74 /DNA_ID=CAMNT_0007537089 /DNA_START=42 /DNA_END=263 /DNA_ORIENTATION=+